MDIVMRAVYLGRLRLLVIVHRIVLLLVEMVYVLDLMEERI